jgi:hypothetical protein
MSDIDFQTESAGHKKPEFDQLLGILKNEGQNNESIVGVKVFYGLSDITPDQQKQLEPVWRDLPTSYKHKMLVAFTEASEADFELSYKQVGLLGLKDESSLIRAASVDLLWDDESVDTLRLFLKLIRTDDSPEVKARALVGLGKFILLGEYEEIPEIMALDAQQLALSLHTDPKQPLEIRRRALEALSNSSHAQKDKLIREAYNSREHLLRVSAVFAMGRTCDEKWQDILLEELDSSDNEIVYEAVRACGEIQLSSSVRQLGELILGDDREIQIMAIWSLGEIGGKHALDILTSLQESEEDEDLLQIIDEALDVASFSLTGAMFDFDMDDEY